MNEITKDIKILKTKCTPSTDDKYNEEVTTKLFNVLNESENGIGLSCNQINITDAKVCVINIKEPIILVNPKITKTSDEKFIFPEGCLSFPNKHIRTERYVEVTVEADNHEEQLSFSADSDDVNDAFECACVQHEIAHLDGLTMFDFEYKLEPVNSDKLYGRNQKITISDGSETKTLKYKKALPLIESGDWRIVISESLI